jgi:hypothetical protein
MKGQVVAGVLIKTELRYLDCVTEQKSTITTEKTDEYGKQREIDMLMQAHLAQSM